VNGRLYASAPLSPVKSPWYPFDRSLGGPQTQSGFYREEKNLIPLLGVKP
jgi:hypothetical protein